MMAYNNVSWTQWLMFMATIPFAFDCPAGNIKSISGKDNAIYGYLKSPDS